MQIPRTMAEELRGVGIRGLVFIHKHPGGVSPALKFEKLDQMFQRKVLPAFLC